LDRDGERVTTTIRAATLEDVPRLVAMGTRFRAGSAYAAAMPANAAQMAQTAAAVIRHADGVVFVTEADGDLTGMIGLQVYVHPFSGARVAGELFWWVEPEARGDGVRLLRRAEAWAAAQGAAQLQVGAPADAPGVARLFARRGYVALETAYLKPIAAAAPADDLATAAATLEARAEAPAVVSRPALRPDLGADAIHVPDDVVPANYRQWARDRPFGTVEIGGIPWHGIAPCQDDTLKAWIRAHYPHAVPGLSVFRQSPAGQVEPSYVHTDRDMGDWTGILYLTDDPPPEDGTAFWRSVATGATASTAMTPEAILAEGLTWRDAAQWARWHTVAAAPGRLVLFPAPCFHSRAIRENYGAGAAARLIQVVFGTGTLEEVA
jgi:GNAT superfamily N-acetyltransferase